MLKLSLKHLYNMDSEIVERLNHEGSVLIIGAEGQSIGVLVDQGEYENLRAIAELASTKEGIESITSEDSNSDRELVSAEDVHKYYSTHR